MENKSIEKETQARSAEELSDNELGNVSGGTASFDNKTHKCPICGIMKPTGVELSEFIYEFRCSCGTVFNVAYDGNQPFTMCITDIEGKPNPHAEWHNIWRI